jgi:hypothetical protein
MKLCSGAAGEYVGGLLVSIALVASPAASLAAEGARILYVEPFPTVSARSDAATEALHKSGAQTSQKVSFGAYGKHFELSIEPNDRLAQLQAKTGAASLQLYRGRIDGISGSWVRLAVKANAAGGSDVSGMLWDGAELYAIEPAAEVHAAVVAPSSIESATVIFRLADVLMDSAATSCAAGVANEERKASEAFGSLVQELKGTPAIMQAAGASRRLQISAIADALFLQRHASSQLAREEILLRLNNVDGIYSSQLGIEVQVPTLQIHDAQSDPLSHTTSSSSLLTELAELRRRSTELRSRGLTHLFTGRNLDGSTVGIAYLGSLCDEKYAVGLTEINGRGSWIESLITAHEIGHNFGAVHDGEPGDACASTPTGQFLMSGSINGRDTFSQCSLDLMQPTAQLATCISALPPADVSIAADLGMAHRAVGRPFEWDLAVINVGGSTAVGVHVEVVIPSAVTVTDAYVTGGTCTSGAGTVQCQLGNVQGGASGAVHLTLHSDVVGSSPISARIGALNEIHLANNDGDGTLLIDPEADLALSMQAPATTAIGETFQLTLALVNNASIQASSIDVTIDLPGGVTALESLLGGMPCTIEITQLRCAVPSLAPGGTVTGRMSFNASVAGSTKLRARASGSYVDPDASNDTAEQTVSVTGTVMPAAQTSAAVSSSGGGGSTGLVFLLGLATLQYARRRSRGASKFSEFG